MRDYTLIALLTPVGIVAINRRKVPFQGRWNLIGGKVEPGESHLTGAARETFEESGVRLPELRFTALGVMNWMIDGQSQGNIYLYTARVGEELALPRMTREGLLAALDPLWLCSRDNQGVIPDLTEVLPRMMSGRVHLDLVAHYHGDQFTALVDYEGGSADD
ncbi:NUDIX domain-containing protein [Lacticaseibacillus pabuli]|uniref:NUDIX domain-containing protein n=1 Tax=Lacticaseibacillus pabuli TaxID=3025672 RepID=A0ABY7WQ99_9LACO|nr:NUDIX domain-containing protein [Lacticaseibacillus sp. KACC 23028]WDF82291.1 NUDIX domain-containing protein [Lacticaseibacillus sp. KACC 23028]